MVHRKVGDQAKVFVIFNELNCRAIKLNNLPDGLPFDFEELIESLL